MATPTSKLHALPVNKSVVFYSPVEGDDVLVRTGTVSEGSCMYHALLHAHSKEYTALDNKGRRAFVERLLTSTAKKVTLDKWEESGIACHEKALGILSEIYAYLEDRKSQVESKRAKKVLDHILKREKGDPQVYKILAELVPLEKRFEGILSTAYSKATSLSGYRDIILSELDSFLGSHKDLTAIDTRRSEYIKGAVSDLVSHVVKEAERGVLKEYISNLKSGDVVDTYVLGLLSNRFDRDIYILDGATRMPHHSLFSRGNLQGRKSIIVMRIDGSHYEVVGKLLPGNRIQREFDSDDPVVSKLSMFLCNPELAGAKYPELAPYLSRPQMSPTPSDDDYSEHDEEYYSSDNET